MDKAWDFHWVLRFSCIVLFIDAALVLKGGKGLLYWSAKTESLLQDLGFLLVATAAFGILVSFALPTLAYFVRLILWRFASVAAPDRGERSAGDVPAERLRERALERESDFLLRLYEQSLKQRGRERADLENWGNLVFATVAIAIADGALPLIYADAGSLVHDALAPLGDWGWKLAGLLLLVACTFLRITWFAPERPHVVFYPPLDKELREQQRKIHDGP
ncbi:hypothetical protein A6R71_16730 [Xanthomonas translucens pv. arrhenatheri]|nr:hypothetical protein A6R71_16730 [Xanthomonas translucens pv. arrhenatheri]